MNITIFVFLTGLGFFIAGSVSAAPFRSTPQAQAFVEGQRIYQKESSSYELDSKTRADLETDQLVVGQLQNFAPSPMSAQRMSYMLTHPLMDVAEIQSRQEAIRFIADHDELFELMTQLFERHPYTAHSHQSDWTNAQGTQQLFDALTLSMPTAMVVAAIFALDNGQWIQAPPETNRLRMTLGSFVPLINSIMLPVANKGFTDFIMAKDRAAQLSHLYQNKILTQTQWGREILDQCAAHQKCINGIRDLGRGIPSNSALRSLLTISGVGGLTSLPPRIFGMYHRTRVMKLMSVAIELETFYAFAKYYRSYRTSLEFPKLIEQDKPSLIIEEGHHPYLLFNPQHQSAANSIEFLNFKKSIGTSTYILTGPNTGGKTTFLRMIGNLGIMAQVGLPVPVKAMELTPLQYIASFASVGDTVTQGHSTFFAQAKSVGDIQSRTAQQQPSLILTDEILTGTSKAEHNALEWAVLEDFNQSPNVLTLLATHDRSLVELEKQMSGVSNIHVTLSGHRVEGGASTDYNAFVTAQKAGVKTQTLERAQELFGQRNPGSTCLPLLK